MNVRESGRRGEDYARHYLVNKGYRVLDLNFRVREGELDIVAEQEETIVFVEVKWRRNAAFARPGESVTAGKQHRLRATASAWLSQHGGDDRPARFDVIEIVAGISDNMPRIHHIENAFT